MKNLGILLALGTATLFGACNQTINSEKDVTRKVTPPFESINTTQIEELIDPSQEQRIATRYGSELIIPANIFTTTNGNPYTGNVKLTFDEYHSEAEIIASGIPMAYDSAGVQYHLTSAGMFNIDFKGENGEELAVANGQNISVNLASNKLEQNYNYYKIESTEKQVSEASLLQITTTNQRSVTLEQASTGTINWNYLSPSATPQENPKKVAALKKIGLQKPSEPKASEDDAFKFDIEVNTASYPELAQFQHIIWQYNGEKGTQNDPEANSKIFNTNWTNIKLNPSEKAGEYTIALSTKATAINIPVVPVLEGADLVNAQAQFKKQMSLYEKELGQKLSSNSALARMGSVIRTFTLNQSGIYNIDRIYHMEQNTVPLQASFEAIGTDSKVDRVYQIVREGNSSAIVQYTPEKFNTFSYCKLMNNALILPLENNQVAILSSKDLKEQLKEVKPNQAFTFKVPVKENYIVSSPDKLQALIKTSI